ncbi:MAG: hypothetical protein HOL66_13405 [Rhodospirillaceae bacterium]|jgi:hypothetical protein|nr:hypothetical protein [Rhodospirillaceae bacterium]MBT5245228.1 hypothetical protein [Rhodospirillaceae bacterium]MBT5562759.1 hypothetical protein [Rhodospirillaceae bacterium]MBT6241928.1 hypothetical protein [Rhodospirillaceae bacterium]MBT7137835.1 hypothetical protein [Rhodospirillaceae bacterium]
MMRSYHRDGKGLIRFIAYSPEPVEGCFRFNDVLQIFSLPDDAPKPEHSYADHPFVIEYSFEEMDIAELREVRTAGLSPSSDTPPDNFLKTEHHWCKQQEILSVLSVITRHLIKKETTQHRWILDTEGDVLTGKFAQTGYYWKGFGELGEWFSTPFSPEITFIDSNTYYGEFGVTGKLLDLSDATVPLLEKYFELGDEEKIAFLSASVLFSQALEAWSVSDSLTYIGIVSSLEALIEFDHRSAKTNHCPNCGQPTYKIRKKFLDFMSTYGSNDESFRKFADRLYSRRSGIGHQGKLLAGDIAGQVVSPSDETRDWWELGQLSRVARVCLVNWLNRER